MHHAMFRHLLARLAAGETAPIAAVDVGGRPEARPPAGSSAPPASGSMRAVAVAVRVAGDGRHVVAAGDGRRVVAILVAEDHRTVRHMVDTGGPDADIADHAVWRDLGLMDAGR